MLDAVQAAFNYYQKLIGAKTAIGIAKKAMAAAIRETEE